MQVHRSLATSSHSSTGLETWCTHGQCQMGQTHDSNSAFPAFDMGMVLSQRTQTTACKESECHFTDTKLQTA